MAVEKTYKVIDEAGIHARPATKLVQMAGRFDSEISIDSQGKASNLKSIMGVMSMGISKGVAFKIQASGHDEVEAIARIEELLKTEGLAE